MLVSQAWRGKIVYRGRMPLPVSHSLAGAAIYAALDRDGDRTAPMRLGLAVALANAPDLDLLPGVLLGDPNRFHHGATHSLLTALAVGLLAAWALASVGSRWPARGRLPGWAGTALIVGACWASHVVLDVLTHDPSPPAGVPALWPLSEARFSGPALFSRADKVAGLASPLQFAASLMSWHNLKAIGFEAVALAPLLWLARRSRRGPEA